MAPASVHHILDKRLLFVTGKGGVGKTSVAAALGLLAARRGKRTIVCEVAEQEQVPRALGGSGSGYREVGVAPALWSISIDPQLVKEEWLRYQLRSAALAGVLGHSRIFQYLTAAAPGLSELVTVGKIWELAQVERIAAGSAPYDLVIVDAPSTGQALGMVRAPRTFADVARVGPINRQAGRIHSFVSDPSATGVLCVALPEEMPVNEAIELVERLRTQMGMAVDAVVVNSLYPERFSTAEVRLLEVADGRGSPQARAALRAALSEHRRARAQQAQLRRLRQAVDAPVTTLPYLFEPELGRRELERLSEELERRL